MSPLLRGLAVAVAALALSCDQLAPGLRVRVTLDPGLRASCVRLRVHTSQDTAAAPAEELALAREAGDGELLVAVYQGNLPRDVWLAAQPLHGQGCEAATLKPNGAPAVVRAAFPSAELTTVEVALGPPARSEDVDGDGFAGNGGPDCLDGNPDAFPEAAERCLEPVDYDCDGLVGCADPGCPAAACVELPPALAFVGTPQGLVAGACSSPVVVETRTLAGAPWAVTSPLPIGFVSPDGALSIFSTASCGSAATQAVVPPGSARAQVYLRGTVAGQGTLQATAPGLAPISQVHPIQAAAPAALVYLTAPQTVALGLCSGAVTVQLRDAFANPAPVAMARTVGLGSTAPATTLFHGDPACGTPAVSALDIPAGGHSLTFYFRSSAASAGTVTLTASAGAGPLTATQTETLLQRTPTRIAFTSAPVSVPQGQCSGALTLQAQDGTGGAAPVALDTAVSLSADTGTLTFYPDGSCGSAPASSVTIPGGAAQVPFSFVGSQAGTPTITASTAMLGMATQTETVTEVAPTRLAFTTLSKTVTADQCSGPVTVEARDGGGTARPVLANTTVLFTDDAPSGTFTLYLGSGCGGTPIADALIPAGSSQATVSFRATRPPGVSLTASATGLAPATQLHTVGAGAPAALVFSTAPQSVIESRCSAPATVELRDAYGNVAAAATGGVAINLTSTFGGSLTFHGTSACTSGDAISSVAIASGGSGASFHFRSSQVGSPTLTATPAGGGISAAAQVQTISPAPPTLLAFTSTARTPPADQCSGPLTVETRDALGARPVLADTTVDFTSDAPAGTLTFYAGGGCAGSAVTGVVIPNGGTTATVSFRGTRAGQPTVTASATGLTPASQPQTILPGPPAALAFLGSAQTLAAGTCSAPATVELRDAFANPTPAATSLPVGLTSTLPAGFTFHATAGDCASGTPVSSVAIASGATTATFFFQGTQTGAGTIDGSAAGLAPASQGVTITTGAPVSLTFAVPSATSTAGQCSGLITLEARDVGGSLAPAAANVTVTLGSTLAGISFFAQPGCAGPAGSTVTLAAGNSSVSFSFRTDIAAAGTVDSSTATLGNSSLAVTVNPGPAARLAFVGASITLGAGACSGTVRALAIQLQDTFANPVTRTGGPLTVTLTPAAGSGLSFFGDSACGTGTGSVTIPNGSTTSGDFFFQTTVAGTWNVTASGGGYTDAVQAETVNAGPPAALAFTSLPRTVMAGACSGNPAVQLQVQDAFGNPSPVAAATTVTITPGSEKFFDRNNCQAAGELLGGLLPLAANAATASFYFKAPASPGLYTITVSEPSLAPASQDQTIQ